MKKIELQKDLDQKMKNMDKKLQVQRKLEQIISEGIENDHTLDYDPF